MSRPAFEIIRRAVDRPLVVTHSSVCIASIDPLTGEIVDSYEGPNLITDAGDIYYAELGIAATQPTNFTFATTPYAFNGQIEVYELNTTTPTKPDQRDALDGNDLAIGAMETGYPKLSDNDQRNGGGAAGAVDIITYFTLFSGPSFGPNTVNALCLTNPTPGTSEPLLMWATFAGVAKTTSNELAVFINHRVNGIA